MQGYLGQPGITAKVIRDGWYTTGDIAFLDADDFIHITGRQSRFSKIGGEMVSLVRVEDVLDRLLPDDCQCCVVEVPDAARGARIVAAVTASVDEKEILAQMAESLPRIALPKQFVVLPELPKMSSGKLDFRTITEETASTHDGEHQGKPFYNGLIEYITSGPSVLGALEGPDAVAVTRSTIGATNPVNAAPGTIRGDLGVMTGRNLIHGSDSPESAARAVALFFGDRDLAGWARGTARSILE